MSCAISCGLWLWIGLDWILVVSSEFLDCLRRYWEDLKLLRHVKKDILWLEMTPFSTWEVSISSLDNDKQIGAMRRERGHF